MQEKDGKYIFGVVKVGDALLLLGDHNGMPLVKTQIFEGLVGQIKEGLTK